MKLIKYSLNQLYHGSEDRQIVTFTEFNRMTNNTVDWLEFTNKMYEASGLSHRMKSDDQVIINPPNYYKYVPKILDETPKHVVANYFAWIIISQLGHHTGKKFKNISDQYQLDRYGYIEGKLKMQIKIANNKIYIVKRMKILRRLALWEWNNISVMLLVEYMYKIMLIKIIRNWWTCQLG